MASLIISLPNFLGRSMAEEEEQVDDDHGHVCVECGEFIPCTDDECEDPFEDTVCEECLEEDLDQIEEENAI